MTSPHERHRPPSRVALSCVVRDEAPRTRALEDGVETLAEQVNRWHAKRDPCSFDLSLRPHQPLSHRALRYQECACGLVDGGPAEGAQGERNLRLDGERRVAAGEDELHA